MTEVRVLESRAAVFWHIGRLIRDEAWRTMCWPRLVRVSGRSMTPTFEPGDWLVVSTHQTAPPRPGDAVLVRHPDTTKRLLIKRVRSVTAERFSVGSDNPWEGQDSRHFGPLRHSDYIGPVVGRWRAKVERKRGRRPS